MWIRKSWEWDRELKMNPMVNFEEEGNKSSSMIDATTDEGLAAMSMLGIPIKVRPPSPDIM